MKIFTWLLIEQLKLLIWTYELTIKEQRRTQMYYCSFKIEMYFNTQNNKKIFWDFNLLKNN